MLGAKEKRSEHDESQLYVKRALAAWKDAQNYFENVSDPDLIEFAVYDMQAAERRYEYMIKCAKRGKNEPWDTAARLESQAPPAKAEEDGDMGETKRIDKNAIRQMIRRLSSGAQDGPASGS